MVDEAPGAAGERHASAVTPFPADRIRKAPARLLESMLVICGEQGYEGTSVQDVIERAGASRATFYAHFTDKQDCFVRAYRDTCEWVTARVLSAARRQTGWREGVRAGLAELLELCAYQPAIARSIVIEAHAAGGGALQQHDSLLEALAEALDEARHELPSDRSPPPTTAAFTVGAVESLLREKLMAGEGERVPEMLPSLLYFVVMQFFGEKAAWEEMAAAPLASWDLRRRAASGDVVA